MRAIHLNVGVDPTAETSFISNILKASGSVQYVSVLNRPLLHTCIKYLRIPDDFNGSQSSINPKIIEVSCTPTPHFDCEREGALPRPLSH